MKALGQARGALERARRAAARTRPSACRRRHVERVPLGELRGRRRRARAAGRPCARRRRGRRRARRARRVDDHRRVEAGGPGRGRRRHRRHGRDRLCASASASTAVGEETALAGIQRLVAAGAGVALAHPGARGPGRRTPLLRRRRVRDRDLRRLGGRSATSTAAVIRTVTVLVISCPHALGLAIPLVISISTSLAAGSGILVKDRLSLERSRLVDVVLFDKTGHADARRARRHGRRRARSATTCWPRQAPSRPRASIRSRARSSPRRASKARSRSRATFAP